MRKAASASVLDVGLPEGLRRPVGDVRAEDVAALAPAGPLIPLGAGAPEQACPRGDRRIRDEVDDVAAGRAGVVREEAADLPLQAAPVEGPAGPGQAVGQAGEAGLDPLGEPDVDRLLLLAALYRPDQEEGLRALGPGAGLGLHPVPDRPPVVGLGNLPGPPAQRALRGPHQIAAARALSWRTRPHSVRLWFEVMIVAFFWYRVAITS